MTLRELAKEAGVHFSTVSLALRDHPRIPQSTRSRIKALAAQRGYLRNPLIGQMMAQRRRARTVPVKESLAWLHLLPEPAPAEIVARADANFLAAQNHATTLGYGMELVRVHDQQISMKRLKNILSTRSVRGIIIGAGLANRAHLSLELSSFAPLCIGHTLLRPVLHRVSHDHQHGIRLALHELRRRGYHRIGLWLRRRIEMRIDYQWSTGYLLYARMHPNLHLVEPCVVEQYEWDSFRAWLRQNQPEVILSSDNEVLQMLQAEGAKVDFLHLDSGTAHAPCAGIHQNNDEVGRAAVDWVVDLLEGQKFGIPTIPRVMLVEGTWHEGPTLRKPRAGSR
ncbi:MAG: LacI family DNA-binding transcriptional regulator [Verrucomicrobiales bacterium]